MAIALGTCAICGIPATTANDNVCQYCLNEMLDTLQRAEANDPTQLIQSVYLEAQALRAAAIALALNPPTGPTN